MNLVENLAAAAPSMPQIDWLSGETEKWIEILEASVVEERYRLRQREVTASLGELRTLGELHDAHPVIAKLVQCIETRDITGYSRAHDDLQRIEKIRHDEARRVQIEATLSVAVPGLVEAVSSSVGDPAWDERLGTWRSAWFWAVADNWLAKRSDFQYQEQLWQRRQVAERQIADLLADSAAMRAWTHFFTRLKPRQAAALKSWREAVRAMGKGTGRSAKMERLRREARQYMEECREAVPVWIMPRYLVAEMITPTPDRYDVVIVDEASQLGIESLFLFYISKKMVVVGDDQQISPYGVGISDSAVADLQHHYLEGIPHHHALSAQSSLYANAKIRFGQNIVLREHFRCMPEIIQFSNDLCYASNGTPLDPLRSYPTNRLKPLVLRQVNDGYRTGSTQYAVNEPEADAIVAQIVGCIDDPRYQSRTMGVISLQGEAQAKLIERKLLQALEPEVIEERRLLCGDAYAFQGDERHVIFLSMVAAPNERIGTLSNDSARQRFNVAASRAQDQLWLFHSAGLDVLSPACMRHRLLSYMLSPSRQIADAAGHRFDSNFERDVFAAVCQRGFHVRTQVCVGDPTNHRYRIDLVVEGMQGRLAVECDGDEWHGPERYEQDMARQRDLERAGWQFVRIRGGTFYRDQTKALAPLWAELERLGIQAGGIDECVPEPPAPAQEGRTARKELEEAVPFGDLDSRNDGAGTVTATQMVVQDGVYSEATDGTFRATGSGKSLLANYVAFQGEAGPDPRAANAPAVADGLCRIIDVEGPILVKRTYDLYLRGCGIKRLGGELKSLMNKALMSAVRQGRVVSENEIGESGLLHSTVRPVGTPPVKLRCRGPRTFEEIPPRELRLAARHIIARDQIDFGTDEHLRAILEFFDLKRLTAQVGTSLLEILEREDERTNEDLFRS